MNMPSTLYVSVNHPDADVIDPRDIAGDDLPKGHCLHGPGIMDGIEKEQRITALEAEVKHWKMNHNEMVARNAVLRNRPDLPADRLPAVARLEQRITSLEAENAKFHNTRVNPECGTGVGDKPACGGCVWCENAKMVDRIAALESENAKLRDELEAAEARDLNRLTGRDPHECVKCGAVDCVCHTPRVEQHPNAPVPNDFRTF